MSKRVNKTSIATVALLSATMIFATTLDAVAGARDVPGAAPARVDQAVVPQQAGPAAGGYHRGHHFIIDVFARDQDRRGALPKTPVPPSPRTISVFNCGENKLCCLKVPKDPKDDDGKTCLDFATECKDLGGTSSGGETTGSCTFPSEPKG